MEEIQLLQIAMYIISGILVIWSMAQILVIYLIILASEPGKITGINVTHQTVALVISFIIAMIARSLPIISTLYI